MENKTKEKTQRERESITNAKQENSNGRSRR